MLIVFIIPCVQATLAVSPVASKGESATYYRQWMIEYMIQVIQKLMMVGCQVTFLHIKAVKTTIGRPICPPLMSKARYTEVRW